MEKETKKDKGRDSCSGRVSSCDCRGAEQPSAAPSAWWSCERALAPPAATWPLYPSTFHWCAKDSSNWEDWWCRRPRGRVDEQIRGFFCLFVCFSFFGVDGGISSVWLGLELSVRRPSWSGPSCSGAVTGIIEQLLRDILPLAFACYGKLRVPEWAPVCGNPAFSETDEHLFYFF